MAVHQVLEGGPVPREITGTVVGVHDGDAITVLTEAKETVKVRLAGIDAPELGQPFGKASKQALSNMVFKKSVRVSIDSTDRYGREVGWVFMDDVSANELQVAAGLAWCYQHFAPKAVRLSGLEAAAREAKQGLWSANDPVPP